MQASMKGQALISLGLCRYLFACPSDFGAEGQSAQRGPAPQAAHSKLTALSRRSSLHEPTNVLQGTQWSCIFATHLYRPLEMAPSPCG